MPPLPTSLIHTDKRVTVIRGLLGPWANTALLLRTGSGDMRTDIGDIVVIMPGWRRRELITRLHHAGFAVHTFRQLEVISPAATCPELWPQARRDWSISLALGAFVLLFALVNIFLGRVFEFLPLAIAFGIGCFVLAIALFLPASYNYARGRYEVDDVDK